MTYAGHVMARFTVPASTTIDTTSTAGGSDTVTVPAGDYFIDADPLGTDSLISTLQGTLQAVDASWLVTLSTGASGTGKVSISCDGTWSITWTSTALRDLLGFTANISSATGTRTGTNHARGLWLPDCPLSLDGNYLGAPDVTDMRQTESPDGFTITHVGNRKYRHRNVRWSHVPGNKTWVASETTTHESLQRFLIDTQWGLGHSWFTPGSKCYIMTHSGQSVGNDGVDGWYLNGLRSMEEVVTRVDGGGFDGLWRVAIPSITSDG